VSVVIGELSNSGAIPSLELMVRFAGARQRVLAHNVANLDTPDFRPTDVSPAAFQSALGRAIDQRRARTGGMTGELPFGGNAQVRREADGRLTLRPTSPSGSILFHDRNNRDLERLMQDNTENASALRVAVDLLRSRYEILRTAISERV
jgi:flagellar basal-body rod protein FlgB